MNKKESQTYYQSTYDIYVGNVPKNTKEADVKHLFLKYGEIRQVLCRWKEDHFGYAIVKFACKTDAERLLCETDEVNLNGHTMPVKAARRSDHNHHNGYISQENKVSSYSEVNKNKMYPAVPFSNTDFGYFHHPQYVEESFAQSYPLMLEVICTNVEDAITFYGCSVNRYEELLHLSDMLNKLNPNHSRHERKPVLNKVYAAKFSEDNALYRCAITHNALSNKSGKCSVRYIDYGNEEEVNINDLISLPESLQKIPAFAKKFVFSNLVCDSKLPNKKTYLHQLVNKRMSLSAYLSTMNIDYQVIKCSCNGKDVILETISKGFAKVQSSRSASTKNQSQYSDIPSKPKAYASGSEIRLFKSDNSSQTSNTKSNENQTVNDSAIKTRKQSCKSKDSLPKTEIQCNGITEDNKKEPDFHPKIIIKRGSELSDIVGSADSSLQPKEQDFTKTVVFQNPFSPLMDNVISNLKLINDVRSLVSKSSDDRIISCAVNLLKEEFNTIEGAENASKCLGDALDAYHSAIEKIKNCTDTVNLPLYKSERDSSRKDLCDKLKEYLGSCDSSIFERKDKIQKTITDLESNSNAWMNVQLKKRPETIDELIMEYNKVKDHRWNLVSKTRENTNKKHKHFLEIFSALQKEFHLDLSAENEASSSKTSVSYIGKPTSYAELLNEALKDLGKALEEEIQMLTLNKVPNHISVIKCLLDILDIHKEKIDTVCELYENRFAMFNELVKVPDISELLSELKVTKKDICKVATDVGQLVMKDKETEHSSCIKELHRLLLKENYIMEVVAKASESYFPELLLEYPELMLTKCTENKYLLKNWKSNYFIHSGTGCRKNSFLSKLHDVTVEIKEYGFENMEQFNAFVQKAATWNSIKNDSLVKIEAMFSKDEKTMCVLLPPISSTFIGNGLARSFSGGEMACKLLRQVLTALKDLHSQGLVHHSIHPSTVLIENESAQLDFCYDPTFWTDAANLKGINFQPPEKDSEHESVDMYGFGCLVLWVIFPNLSFSSTKVGVPNLAAFRSIVEEIILPKDYALLCALVDAEPERRPSASTLLSKGFLTRYESYCRSKTDQKKILS